MQLAWSRIWTRVAVSISYNDNHYTTGTSSKKKMASCWQSPEAEDTPPTQIITETDCAYDIAFLANTTTQAKSLLRGLKRDAGGIGR